MKILTTKTNYTYKGTLPNSFIVGAAKGATTSLYFYLKQHPEIYMSPVKEPKFFSVPANKFPHKGPGDEEVDKTVIKTWGEYLALFNNVKKEKAIGEASADYLYFHETVAPLIKEKIPAARIIIILRNPVERAFSAYLHLLRDKRENLSFEKALEFEKERKHNNYEFIWFYKDVGFYSNQVATYIKFFGRERVEICLYEEFKEKPLKVIKEIFSFLNVDPNFTPDISHAYNISKIPISRIVNDILTDYNHPLKLILRPVLLNILGKKRLERLVNYFKEKNLLKIKPYTKKYLIKLYEPDILKLQDLINKDLSFWLRMR